MTHDEYQNVKVIFNSALDVPPAERQKFVAESCSNQPELRDTVERLLSSYEMAQAFIEVPAIESAREILDESLVESPIGSYRILREIGRGGMGTVFLAQRADAEFQQQVAVKLVKRGMDTDEILRRFRQERQILAELNHPNIARLLDGGTTSDGRPYFVMEYVNGLPIKQFCTENDLDTSDRLRVFRQVCSAVDYAHQNLVVHRDIKPSNILVTTDGTPKLLDFGIAKLIAPDGRMTQTATKLGAMTPEYASPEQIRGEKITTATDIYSLGKTLSGLIEKPDRDLEAILQTALRDEPKHRYGSAEQLSEDIRRFLEHLPVLAQRDSFRYRAGKFIGRNKIAVAAAGLILLLLMTGVASVAYQSRVVAAERDRARIAQLKAERINAFLQETLGSPNPNEQGRDVKVVDVLDRAALRAETELADQPEVLAEVQRSIGVTYYNLEVFDKAGPLLRSAAGKFVEVYGENDPRTAAALKDLGDLLSFSGKVDEAVAVLERATATLAIFPDKLRESLDARYSLAQAHYFKGENDIAESGYREILEIANGSSMDKEMIVADVSHELANLIRDRDDAAAIELYRRSAEIVRPLPDKRMNLATCLSNLGMVLIEMERFEEAEGHLNESLTIRRELFGESSPSVSVVLTNLSRIYAHRGDLKRAEGAAREAVEILEKTLPSNHRNFATAYVALGDILLKTSNFTEAETCLKKAIATYVEKNELRRIAVAEGMLGECLARQHRLSEAVPLLNRSYEKLRSELGDGHPRTIEARKRLAKITTL